MEPTISIGFLLVDTATAVNYYIDRRYIGLSVPKHILAKSMKAEDDDVTEDVAAAAQAFC